MKTLSKLKILFIVAVTSLVLFLLAFYYYKSESGQIIKEKHEFLDAVTNIKLEQIVDWRKERIAEAKFFSTIGKVIKYTETLKINKNDKEAQNYFSNTFLQFVKNIYVENIFISSTKGEILYTLDSAFRKIEQARIEEIKYAIEKDSIIIGDFYFSEIDKTVYFNIISGIKDNFGILIGFFVQQVNPNKTFYPLILKWPTLSKTAETLLFKKEGDHIVYLNQLRHKKNTVASLKIPISETEVVAVKVVLGARGIVEGKDYRGVDVLAAVRKVPGSNWFMVSKMDKDELYSELFYRAGIISLIALITILLTTLTALYIYKLQQSSIYKNLFLKEKELSETQEEYRTTLYSIGDAVITTDTKGKIRQMNSVAETLTGWSEKETKGQSLSKVFNIFNEDTSESVENPVDRVLKDGIIVGLANHTMLISKNGTKIPIADSGSPIKNSDGKITGVVLVFRDQTEEREKEKKLIESEERFRNAFTTSPDAVNITRMIDGKYVSVNRGFQIMTGYNEEEIIGKTSLEINIWKETADREKLLEGLKSTGTVENLEARFKLKNGKYIDGLMSATILELNGEKHILSITRDISERKKAEEIIKSSEANLNSLINNRNESIWSIDKDYNYIVINDFFSEAYNNNFNQRITKGLNAVEILTPELKAFWKPKYDAALSGKKTEFEFSYEMDNELKYFQVSLNPIISDGTIQGVSALSVDITERKRMQDALADREIELRNLADSSPGLMGTFYLRPDGSVCMPYTSPQIQDLFGLRPEDVVDNAAPLLARTHPDDVTLVNESIAESARNMTAWHCEYRVLHPTRGELWLESSTNPRPHPNGGVIWYGFVHDITKRKRIEEALRLSEANLQLALEAARLGDWSWDIVTGEVVWSAQCKALYGLPPDTVVTYELFLERLHPDERERIDAALRRAVEERSDYDVEKRAVWLDGSVHWNVSRGRVLCNAAGEPVRMVGVTLEITEIKRAEEALRQANLVVENSSAVLFRWRAAEGWPVVLVSQNVIQFGYTPEEFLNGSILFKSIIHPDDRERISREVQSYSESGVERFKQEYRILSKDGTIHWVDDQTVVERNTDGQVTHYQGIIVDITERRNTEKALKESEELYRTLINTSPDAVAVTDPGGYITFISNKSLEIFGTSSIQEVIGHNFLEWVAAQDREKAGKNFKYLIDGESQTDKEYLLLKKNGSTFWGETNAAPVYGTDGKLQSIIIVTRDISVRKRTEESIRKLSLAVEQSPATIVITDVKGNIEYVNPKFTDVTGYSFEEVKGKNPRILKSGTMSSENYTQMWNDLAAGKEWYGEFHNRKKNGEYYWESASISPIFSDKGEITNFLAIKQDITEQKRMTSELVEAKEKAEEMNKVKTYFFANMSHELRTPFVGIMGFSELLAESLVNPEEKKYAEQILKSSKRLTDTLNKILNVAKIEFDGIEISYSDLNVDKTVGEIADLYTQSAKFNNTELITDLKFGSSKIISDKELLEEILDNLISNAVKYTKNGQVIVSSEKIQDDGNVYLILMVADTGVGIPEEMQKVVWREFRQVSEGFNRSFEGTGLGLTITKKYIDRLNGTISLKSEEGKGTLFTIKLPVIFAPIDKVKTEKLIKQSTKADTNSNKPKYKVLYVEDDAIALQYISIVLKSSCDIETALTAKSALDLIIKNRYDVLMLDINLGRGMDGLQLMQEIKKIEHYKNIPFVAVTAYAAESDKAEFLAKGFSHYISKPFSSNELKGLLAKIFKALN